MVILAIITSVFVAIQDPIIQKFAVRFAGGYLSEKTGADIKVGRLVVTPDFRLLIGDVTVKDLNQNDLAVIGTLRTKINIGDLLDGKIHLEHVMLRDVTANLIKYEGEDKLNFAFLADAFASDKPKEKESGPMPIIIDRISLKNVDFQYWDQNKDNPSKTANGLMDYAHLDLDGINLDATSFYMFGDSIAARIGSLSATEQSGLDLKHLKTDAVVCQKGIYLDGLEMETNNSLFDLDLHMLYNGFDDFQSFVDSVVFDATIRPTDIMLSDIGVFSGVMYKMPDRVQFESKFTGPIEHFRIDDLKAQIGNSTTIQGSLSMHPLDFENGQHSLNIKKMHFTYDDLANFYIPSSTKTIPLPESLRSLDEGDLKLDFRGSYNDFVSDIKLTSGVGKLDANIGRSRTAKGDNVFSGHVNSEGVKVGTLANANKYIGDLDLNAGFTATIPKKGGIELALDGKATKVQLLGNHIDEIVMDGSMKENRFKGKITVDDDDLNMDFNGLIDFEDKKHPKSDFVAVICDADLHALKIFNEDSISRISTNIYVNMVGFNLDDLEGEVHLDSTTYVDSRGSYFVDDFRASIVNDNLMDRRINVNCDFLDFEMAGKMNFAHLVPTIKDYVNHFVTVPKWSDEITEFQKYKEKHPGETEQDFVVDLTLKDTRTLSRLMMPSVKIAKSTTLNGAYTSRNYSLGLSLRSKNIQVGEVNLNNIELRNSSMSQMSRMRLSLDEIVYRNITEKDTLAVGFDNFAITTRMMNDTVFANLGWDDVSAEDHNKASVNAYFHPHEMGGIFSITDGNITVNDSLWQVTPSNFVDISDGRITLSNLMFSHNMQSLRADGYVPMAVGDTLGVQLRQFDLSNFDILFQRWGFNIDGFITGDATLSDLKANPMVLADLGITNLGVNGDPIGDAVIESQWNNPEKAVELNVNILNEEKKALNLYGSYYTARAVDNLDFTLELDSLKLNALSPFLVGVVSRVQGYGNGLVTITGSLQKPNIDGRLKVNDGGCKVTYLNTFYTFAPTILIDSKTIKLQDMVMVDTLGNRAIVDGVIRHNYLKDIELDLKLHPRDFLAMATTAKDNDSFYGDVFATGMVSALGKTDDIKLNIGARTSKGTRLTLPLNRTSRVSENDFIVFVEKKTENEEDEEEPKEVKVKHKTQFGVNLDVNVTDESSIRIYLPGDIGTIDATGNGNIKLGTSSTEDLSLRGNYVINNGTFKLNLFDFITRNFSLKKGGSISWTGSPTDGRIDATGAYTVKASLASLGMQIDSTSSGGTVNVECLIHLKDALLNPTITFGMSLPNASEDVEQAVFSVLDTTNQAVMTSQAMSLLIVGSFSNVAGGGGMNYLDALTSGGLNINLGDAWGLGVKYHSSATNAYDELQVAVKTELFENRLIIETNFGVLSDNSRATSASNLVGEFDIHYKLTRDGRLMANFYNHSNYNSNLSTFSFDRLAPYTQGLGLSYSKSFDKFSELFKRKKTIVPSGPLFDKNKVKPKQ